jgi:Na+-driven multidrug efflux pump
MDPTILDIMELLGYLLRVLGALVFGLATGWLTMHALRGQRDSWQVAVAVYLGLLAAFVLLGRWVPGGGTLGAFGLGAGAGLLIWGLGAEQSGE